MKLINLVILIMLMSAFAIGVSLSEEDKGEYHMHLNNASVTLSEIDLEKSSSNSYINGFILIVEEYIQFIGILLFEVMKIGIDFGHDNPQYFTPEFIITIMKFLIWIVVISLLIKPIGWLTAFVIIGVIALIEKIKKMRIKKELRLKEEQIEDGR